MSSSVVKQHSIGSIVSNMNDSSLEAGESAEPKVDFRQYGHLFKNTSYEELEQACRSYHAEWTTPDEHGFLDYILAGMQGVEEGVRASYISPGYGIPDELEISLDEGDALDNLRDTIGFSAYAAASVTNLALIKTDFAPLALPWIATNAAIISYNIIKDLRSR